MSAPCSSTSVGDIDYDFREINVRCRAGVPVHVIGVVSVWVGSKR